MGCKADKHGITIRLYKDDSTPADDAPIFGRFAELRSRPRTEVLSSAPASPEEASDLGSEDWLTLVAVADSEEKLKDLVKASGVGPGDNHSSCSSLRVLVLTDVDGKRNKFESRVTLASGMMLPLETGDPTPKVLVNNVKVLAEGVVAISESSELKNQFKGGGVFHQINKVSNV